MNQQQVKSAAVSELQRMTSNMASMHYRTIKMQRNTQITLAITIVNFIIMLIDLYLHLKK